MWSWGWYVVTSVITGDFLVTSNIITLTPDLSQHPAILEGKHGPKLTEDPDTMTWEIFYLDIMWLGIPSIQILWWGWGCKVKLKPNYFAWFLWPQQLQFLESYKETTAIKAIIYGANIPKSSCDPIHVKECKCVPAKMLQSSYITTSLKLWIIII